MNSLPLRRTALALLLGMMLSVTTACAAVDVASPNSPAHTSGAPTASPSPTTSPSSTADASPTTTPTPTPTPDATSSPDAGTTPDGDCPAAPAGAPSGTFDDPYAIGDEIALGCFTVIVTDMNVDATDEVQYANSGSTPTAGNVFAWVMVMIARTAGDPAKAADIEIRFASSPTSSVGHDDGLRLEEQAPPAGTLSPGQATGGTLVFDTPGGPSARVLLRAADGTEAWVAP